MTLPLAVLLGAVQGVTEFLPISSKTHLVVVPGLLGEEPPTLAFIAFMHLGTFFALLLYFAKELVGIAKELPEAGSEGRRIVLMVAIGSVPAGILGLLFEETFERLLRNPREAAFALFVTAALLLAAEWRAGTISIGRRLPQPLRENLKTPDAVWIGLAQAVALLPGVSRSGSTMAMGLGLGLRRDVAARFSFLLALPALAGANLIELPDALAEGFGRTEFIGFLVSFLTGLASIWLLLRYLRRHNYLPFVAYAVIFGTVAGILLS